MIRCEVVFKGRVQGVGFRYTARDMARDLGLSGWVKNCPDGSVRLLAEGESENVESLISRLNGSFQVRETSVSRLTAVNECTDFTIEY